MASWDPELEGRLLDAIKESSRDVTGTAIELLRLSIASIDGEPLPEGAVPGARDPRAGQELAIRMVPVFLRSVSRSREGPIGVFQLLGSAPTLMGMYFAFAYPPP
jgi:hypothetical protein